jgi:hypothetical protein
MFCHKCGTQVNPDVQFCPTCGQAMSSPLASSPLPAVPWTAPVGIKATPSKWIGEGWELVKQDMGNYILISLIFFLLNGVPFIQGALIAGFHIFTMKKLMGRRAEFGDLFKGFNFFIPTLVASLLIGLFSTYRIPALHHPGPGGDLDVQVHLSVYRGQADGFLAGHAGQP